jgi:hypothetical protein
MAAPAQRFYGPVFLELGAASFWWLGFSIESFRLLSVAGAVLLAAACAYLVCALGGSRNLAAVCFALVALTPEMGSRATCGRMDTLTVGLQVFGLALLVSGLKAGNGIRSWAFCLAAGLAWSAALLSTPRSFPFFAALALTSPVLFVLPGIERRRSFVGLAVAGSVPLVIAAAWAATERMTLLSWVGEIASMSQVDPINSSPLLMGEGEWSFNLSPLAIQTPLALAVVFLALAWGARRGWKRQAGENSWLLRFVAGCLLVNVFLNCALLARPEAYGIFWAVPLLPVALVATRKVRGGLYGRGATVFLLVVWVGLASSYLLTRTVKYAEVVGSWRARDPRLLEEFVRAHVQPGSRVYGPIHDYFYAVERSGSSYRLVPNRWFSAPSAETAKEEFGPDPVNEPDAAPPASAPFHSTYFIWREQDPLPPRLPAARLVAQFESPPRSSWLSRLPQVGEYGRTNLYLILGPSHGLRVQELGHVQGQEAAHR